LLKKQKLEEKEEKNLFQQIEFLVAMKLFASWSYNAVKKLFLSMEQLEFQKDKYVYKENEPGEYMYIIKTGEFKVFSMIFHYKIFGKKAAENSVLFEKTRKFAKGT